MVCPAHCGGCSHGLLCELNYSKLFFWDSLASHYLVVLISDYIGFIIGVPHPSVWENEVLFDVPGHFTVDQIEVDGVECWIEMCSQWASWELASFC